VKLLSLRIRGAIGLKPYGDEVFIDFNKFDRGPIAIVGANGSGKTTILESLQPWPAMISRNGSLSKNYYLRDSLRELKFEYGGRTYTSKIVMDGEKNRIETYLYADDRPVNDGKTPSYKARVNELFGDPSIFFKSVFNSQNGAKISALTAGNSKEFFIGLLGLGRYQVWEDRAKENVIKSDRLLVTVRSKIEPLETLIRNNESRLQKRDELKSSIDQLSTEIKIREAKLSEAEKKLRIAEIQASEVEQKKKDVKRLRDELAELRRGNDDEREKQDRSLSEINARISDCDSEIRNNLQLLDKAEEIREREKEYRELGKRKEELDDLKNRIADQQRELERIDDKVSARVERIKIWAENQRRQIEEQKKLASELDSVPCNQSPDLVGSCRLIAAAREASDKIPELEKGLRKLLQETDGYAPEEQKAIDAINARLKELTTNYNQPEHERVCTRYGEMDVCDWGKAIADLDVAQAKIDGLQNQTDLLLDQKEKTSNEYSAREEAFESKASEKTSEIQRLESELKDYPVADIEALRKRKKDIEVAISEWTKMLGEAKGKLVGLDDLEKENVKYRGDLEKLNAELKQVERDITDWRFLETACGKNGLQALELDSAIPQISAIATEVLQEFGREWSVSVNTVRASADKKKDIETFEIITSSPGGVKELDKLSGGEQVWVEESLRKAVSIYLINHSGRDYRTLFQDEADGALDPERAQAFLQTAFKAHELTGAHHTIMISQRPEIWEQIPQRIHLNPEKGEVEIVIN
jgi:exonuclease SbcC